VNGRSLPSSDRNRASVEDCGMLIGDMARWVSAWRVLATIVAPRLIELAPVGVEPNDAMQSFAEADDPAPSRCSECGTSLNEPNSSAPV
jgi:hypothetical protein